MDAEGIRWCGQPLAEMEKDELIAAIVALHQMHEADRREIFRLRMESIVRIAPAP
jgi:hypothetical protein